ncbi:MAG: D-2-hydroxyacid dehydrogenase [Thermodesulfobacteriota bacterium]
MRIVVLDGYTLNPGDNPWEELGELGELVVHDRTHVSQVVERALGAEILLTNKTPIPGEAIRSLPTLRFISVLATGYDIVDVKAAAEKGIPVSNVPVYGTDTVAEHVFALLLELARRPALHDSAVRAGGWWSQPDWCFWKVPLVELAGKVMGIVGFGRIGRRVGEIAHAFGMKVVANDINMAPDPPYVPFQWLSVEELFSQSDFVSLHCYQTQENVGFVNMGLLRRMKPTAFLINTSRGGLINEQDLAQALEMGILAGAALDVVSREPISPENPLLGAPNLIITPHIAWATLEARRRLMRTTVENVRAFLAGNPQNVVNHPVR